MSIPGLVSISFRSLAPKDLIAATAAAKLAAIEWGSDVHAPAANLNALRALGRATREAGLAVSSYGTYWRAGVSPLEEFEALVAGANALGAHFIRVWAGNEGSTVASRTARETTEKAAREAAALARRAGCEMCFECHPNTLTDSLASSRALLAAAPDAAMYWQPNQYDSFENNVAYARAVAPLVRVVHVFAWECTEAGEAANTSRDVRRVPLAAHADAWRAYFAELPAAEYRLLEFMPDNEVASLPREAETLRSFS